MSLLTEEQKKRFAELFKEFDKDKDGIINTTELISLVKSVGKRLSAEEVSQYEKEDVTIDANLFISIMSRKLQEVDDEVTIKQSFATFFGENVSSVSVDEFKKIIMEYGERVSEDEANELINDIGAKDGKIDIAVFIEKVFGK